MPDTQRRASIVGRGWRSVREAGPRRLLLTALLLLVALVLARFSWELPITDDAERALYDWRSSNFSQVISEQDPRVIMVAYTDQTLINLQKRSPLDRGMLASALRNLDAMGVKAIGIDILFDQPQAEDEELVETLRVMETPVAVAYADLTVLEDDLIYEQQTYLEDFLARLEGSSARPASIMLDNGYGVTRVFPENLPQLPPMLGRAMLEQAGEGARALPGYEGAIRYRRPFVSDELTVDVFNTLDIEVLADPEMLAIPELAGYFEQQFRGAYVLIGGRLVDFDRVQTPLTSVTGDTMPGLEVHAHMLAQMLDGARLPRMPTAALWAIAALVVISAAFTGLIEMRSWTFTPLLLAQAALFLGLSFWLEWRGVDTFGFPAIGPVLGWTVAFAAVVSAARASGAVQRRFAQSALGKYLPRSIAQEIIERPELLSLHGEKKQIYVLFSDLEGFTKMSHALEPEMVATLLNRYLEMLSQVVLDHGGVIDKFVGDAVVAFWGAPIAREDDGRRAAEAGYEIWKAGEEFRKSVDPTLPPIGKTRVGLHYGDAVVGNFGGETRIQYTALGDSMNTAARLEAANKTIGTSVLASREFVERSGLGWWRPLGRVVLRGRNRPVDIFEPVPGYGSENRQVLVDAVVMLEHDKEEAIRMLEELASRNPGDIPLRGLVARAKELNEERAYVLG